MKTELYETPKIEVSELEQKDVITTSEFGSGGKGIIGEIDETFWG